LSHELLQDLTVAWRIDEFLERGEIDNRVRGKVTGRLWFAGRAEPVELELQGNAWRDLAGHRLEFVNPDPRDGVPESLAALQTGEVGDITASRKVKVPDVSKEELREYLRRREPFPWHWGNSLYLEWFSDGNGRVVIESASYRLTIDPEGGWEMTEAEEEEQRISNSGALNRFMSRLTEAFESARATEENLPAEVSEENRGARPSEPADQPLTEEEAERLQEESDRLNDRVHARMESEGPDADLGQIIEEEIERARRERGEPDPTPEEQEESRRWIEEMNAAAAEALQGGEEDEEEEHPLAERVRDFSLRVLSEVDRRAWLPAQAAPGHPVVRLQSAILKAGGKLAGALSRREWPPPRLYCASTIVWLKRAHRFLREAQVAAGDCRAAGLLEPAWLDGLVAESEEIASEVMTLITELRELLARGFD
jgi:hypothetical protein